MRIEIHTIKGINNGDSFFDYWNYKNADAILSTPSTKTAEKIAEKIKLQQINEEFPEHCFQLLFLS